MPGRRQIDFFVPLFTVLADAIAIESAFLLAYWIRFYSPLAAVVPVVLGFPPLWAYIQGSFVVIPVWLWLFKSRGMYRPRRNMYFSDEFFAIARLVGVGMIVVMAIAFFYRTFSYSRLVVALLGILAIACVAAARYAAMKFEQWWYRSGHDLRKVVIVGTSATARTIYEKLSRNASLGYEILGYFSTNGAGEMSATSARHLGPVAETPAFSRSAAVDVILIALGESEHGHLTTLVRECEGLHTELLMVPDILELMTSQVRIRHIEGIPFLGIKGLALSTWNQIVKRLFDAAMAAVVLILVSPLFLIIAAAIKLDSRGPVFYRQERVGLDGESFSVLKFRSMRTDAEQSTGPVWARKDDSRTTRVGRFLRRFSMDELPQLINVLKGDMSIVGPRPERPHFVKQFTNEVPRYRERHRVKTGMTGWAQVNGLRGNAPIAERTKYDIYYVENWSLVFDLKIILKTIRTVLFGTDAY